MSKSNGSYPPLWVPSSLPLTQTVASQSTAPKWRMVRLPLRQSAGNVESPAIPQSVRRLHHAGERGFDRVRDQDLTGQVLADRSGVARLAKTKLPEAVEVLPGVADKLGPGVFGQGVVGSNVLGPTGLERTVGRLSSRPLERANRPGWPAKSTARPSACLAWCGSWVLSRSRRGETRPAAARPRSTTRQGLGPVPTSPTPGDLSP